MKRAIVVVLVASLAHTMVLAQKKDHIPQVEVPPVYRGGADPNATPAPQTQASRADLRGSEETRKAVLSAVVSDVAGSYFKLREFDFELEIARRTLTSRQESLRIIKLRQERGVANLLELRQAEELVYNAT